MRIRREIIGIKRRGLSEDQGFPAHLPGTLNGGGGGTAHPRLSLRAGLCLHPECRHRRTGCGACYAATTLRHPSARSAAQGHFSGSMSLYRAGLKLAFFLPLGVTMPLSLTAPSGFTDVSSVLIRSSRIGATLDRTPVRKHYASGSTYVAVSLFSRFALPEQQGRR